MSTEQLDSSLVLDAVRVTEIAAIAASTLVGRGDEKAADQAAVDAMRTALNSLAIDGEIVIGEGERDEAPMLYIGEKVGRGGAAIDIALDPLEGTTLTAKAMANALAVMAWAPKGTLLNAPDTYMDKIACGPGYPAGVIDLDRSAADNVRALAAAKGVSPEEITVCVLDRPRHAEVITSIRSVGARVNLITDGDVAGVMHTADPATGIDLYVGQGGAPEGVLACAALKCVGGQFQGRLVFRNVDEKERARRVGITDLDKKYDLHEMVRADAIFAATGVTKGALLDGIRREGGYIITHSLVMNSSTGDVREVRMRRPV
ncbi:class II fructose-bisphosphatase [Phenylobacterium sp.]|jgi:fructose-1,6-bisphosphatase II / sedoheptulose-1,7-bisphosphatase|uniref:class II fructose-bisphosphatase n=1 Tax=Phenylobacterium sp. TaxID=1871053 RepID=UPI0025F42A88|nr:class II fructose-bisphosphatase [Phenylobacterium sp.]MCA6286583.1 class II fructose-bisphosphatase [Phenylobacterium sp.]MCA6309805.1 class II fructose-bisphosphatase [Phenylobacterium sp.]MCA6322712.1 class II fructose-bisphosphatase [Phenylobacterium sp.]MCA6336085.1 class II fructose-bisphosphatase [Phenylobacterium sp.]MCA6338830.1 class II fructose-bisphosphatase [Phenylobacterium sp.]